ncbi:MAG: haloacid dehalogenase-like hydrolase [Clostridiales bacterium]|nr:haloacid dehalogenase-like hydrolase [Clostridiales bacterium]
MTSKEFERKRKEDKPVIAICYDFDRTLSPDDMQAQGFIQSVDCDVEEFWKDSNGLAADNDMDQNLAYMYQMIEKSRGKVILNKDALLRYGANIKLFNGVDTWFDRIKEYGHKKGVIIEHYIISSGLKEMIEGTAIAKNGAIEKIYASSFYYDKDGVAVWPAQVVNFTNKTQFLFRIAKGILDINDPGVNDHFEPEDIRVPFRNMIYIGDSDTDIPCMRMVSSLGGHSIGVFDANSHNKTKVYKMMKDGRIKYFAPTDYSEGSELEHIVQVIIDRTVDNEILESMYYRYKKECFDFYVRNDEDELKRREAIVAIADSRNFASTHIAIKKLTQYIGKFSEEEMRDLITIAINNGQVRYILKDYDVKVFYTAIISKQTNQSAESAYLLELING